MTLPSSRSLRSDSALLALNSARERAFARRRGLEDLPVARVEAFPHALVNADRLVGARLVEARIIVIARHFVQAKRHVGPGADPFAGIDRTD